MPPKRSSARAPAHPRAEHPLADLPGRPACSLPAAHRMYLTTVMLENSLRQCAQYARGSLLDVGCGRRPYEKTFFKSVDRYVGSDYLSERSQPDVVASALHLPFGSESFDTVLSTEVLEHVPDPAKALAEMSRVLRPGGILILSTPMYWPRHEVPYDFFRYPYDGLMYLVEHAGFEVVRIFNRGHSYAFLAQAFQHVQPINWSAVSWLINRAALWCEGHLRHDVLTMGWTVVGRKKAAA